MKWHSTFSCAVLTYVCNSSPSPPPPLPLQHCAVVSEAAKRKSTVDLLIKKGADVNAQNKESLTPLHCAAGKAHMDVMEVLIKHGARVSREGGREGGGTHQINHTAYLNSVSFGEYWLSSVGTCLHCSGR